MDASAIPDVPIDSDPAADSARAGVVHLVPCGSVDDGRNTLRGRLRLDRGAFTGNVRWHHVDIDQTARRRLNGHAAGAVWLTGLSGAGKSTIANAVERMLFDAGCRTYLLDGDNLRHGLNKDLGFTAADRVENVRRAAEVARILVDAGQIVMASFISPFRSERRMARELFGPGQFVEVHVDVPIAVAEARDPKGLYAKARAGRLANFTGIDSPYEAPERPDLRVDAAITPAEDAALTIVDHLRRNGWLEPRYPASHEGTS